MFCPQCGNYISKIEKFCPLCGCKLSAEVVSAKCSSRFYNQKPSNYAQTGRNKTNQEHQWLIANFKQNKIAKNKPYINFN